VSFTSLARLSPEYEEYEDYIVGNVCFIDNEVGELEIEAPLKPLRGQYLDRTGGYLIQAFDWNCSCFQSPPQLPLTWDTGGSEPLLLHPPLKAAIRNGSVHRGTLTGEIELLGCVVRPAFCWAPIQPEQAAKFDAANPEACSLTKEGLAEAKQKKLQGFRQEDWQPPTNFLLLPCRSILQGSGKIIILARRVSSVQVASPSQLLALLPNVLDALLNRPVHNDVTTNEHGKRVDELHIDARMDTKEPG